MARALSCSSIRFVKHSLFEGELNLEAIPVQVPEAKRQGDSIAVDMKKRVKPRRDYPSHIFPSRSVDDVEEEDVELSATKKGGGGNGP